jgi:glycine/D-amino acid oxidase-like deaminating enzyme
MYTNKPHRQPHWGVPPWHIDFTVRSKPIPASVDFAIVGAGFTGLAAAAWLRRLAPEKSVAVFEADRIGAGASGRTGGMVLAETAAGDLPGLGDVLAGFKKIWQPKRRSGRGNFHPGAPFKSKAARPRAARPQTSANVLRSPRVFVRS